MDQCYVFLLLSNPLLPFCTDTQVCSRPEQMLVQWGNCLVSLYLLVTYIGPEGRMKYSCDTLQGKLCPCVRSQLKVYTLFKGSTQDRGVVLDCSQQKGKFLLFLLSSQKNSRLAGLSEEISYRFRKTDEHWRYLSRNFSLSQIFVKQEGPRLKAKPKLAGAWSGNGVYFIWFETT